ncbi:unnamed protein product [Durusdinium trenchii]|uniref:Uncharacterized protein n=1 Tax=Durusdinium trenchii TaxID=1381693 RepID=A0ABP0LA20_9DINO
MGKKRRRDEEDEAEGGSLGGLGARSWILSRLRTFGLLCLQAATVEPRRTKKEPMPQPGVEARGPANTIQKQGFLTPVKKVVHVQDLRDEELQEREAELAETLRKARLNQGNLRGDPPKTNRILWQRQVTYANNAVHRAEQAYREVRQEIERRTYGASLGISPIRRFRK